MSNISENKSLFDENWRKGYIRKIKNRAGHRYVPERNVSLPIANIFDGLKRTEKFYFSIRENYGELYHKLNDLYYLPKYNSKEIKNKYDILKKEIQPLLKDTSVIKNYSSEKIPWDKINQQMQEISDGLWELIEIWRQEKNSYNVSSDIDKISTYINDLSRIVKEIRYFQNLSLSSKARLSNDPFLLITGAGGSGKTHLLCDVVISQLKNIKLCPDILVFGEYFNKEEPFTQIIKQLKLNISKQQLLEQLNALAEKSNRRALIVIDALNETRHQDFWKKHLETVVNEIKKYPNIGLVISIRTGFENTVVNKNLLNVFVQETHQGFLFKEYEAMTKFFNEFQLPLPEIPLLTPEFQSPLFLLLFCKAFQDRAKQNNKGKPKQIFRGHEGSTYIFESFIKSVSEKISKQFKIPRNGVWNAIIKDMARNMVEKSSDRITEEKMVSLVKKAYPKKDYPKIDHSKFIRELEANLLIHKVPRLLEQNSDGFDIRFTFQKFSDHLIGRYIFKRYEKEFGVSEKNLKTSKKFFSKEKDIGQFLSNPRNIGVVEALSVQISEHFKGEYEFIEVAPYLGSRVKKETFIESLIWRSVKALPKNKKRMLYILKKLKIERDSFFNFFLTVSAIKKHPFNAEFLHKILSKYSMAKRDFYWSTFLHGKCLSYEQDEIDKGYQGTSVVERIIEWVWLYQDKGRINNDTTYLYAIVLGWFLSTPNRFVRDKATKALVSLLTYKLDVVLELLKKFKTVNDPYITERLYAVAYGCAMRSIKDNEGLKKLSQWVYNEIFKSGNPPVHIFIRDYARGVIEVALQRGIKLINFDSKKIKPPFKSRWIDKIPSRELLRKQYYHHVRSPVRSIWCSVMYGEEARLADFGNYVIKHAVKNWSGRKLGEKEINYEKLSNKYESTLTDEQRTLRNKIESCDQIRSVLFRKAIFGDDDISLSESSLNDEVKKYNYAFLNSLSIKQKKMRKQLSIVKHKQDFDADLAYRWVFNRVMKMGWKEELHGEWDLKIRGRAGISGSDKKPERIGKKYQWIALYELLARISDNFEFKSQYNSDQIEFYQGSWQLSIGNIDPSYTLNNITASPQGVPQFSQYKTQMQYSFPNVTDCEWLTKSQALPVPQNLLKWIDSQKNMWVSLKISFDWEEETLPEEKKYYTPKKILWYMLNSYLIKASDKSKVFEWAKKQNFFGRWMPESSRFYSCYLGEYPWAPGYFNYYNDNGWSGLNREGHNLPAKVLQTVNQYLGGELSGDCSMDEGITVSLPVKLILDKMELTQNYVDGRFFDKNDELVAFDPGVFNNHIPTQVLIRKDKLLNFLKCENYALVWTLLGEKNITGREDRKALPHHCTLSGAYTLDDKNKIIGSYQMYT